MGIEPGEKCECYLCAMQHHPLPHIAFLNTSNELFPTLYDQRQKIASLIALVYFF